MSTKWIPTQKVSSSQRHVKKRKKKINLNFLFSTKLRERFELNQVIFSMISTFLFKNKLFIQRLQMTIDG